MSETNILYKVLWVEDEDIFVKPLKIKSKIRYGLELDRYTNWQEAQEALEKDFDSYSAIILDAYCKPDPSSRERVYFLQIALSKLEGVFGRKQKYIPWYVFSGQIMKEGMADFFEAALYSRKQFIEWGEMLYDKTADEGSDMHHEALFKKIQDVAKKQSNNIVLFRHKDVFKYLGGESLIDGNARRHLLRMLGALYFPASEPGIKFEGNPLRKVVEYMFRSAHKIGLLPIECFEQNNQVNLLESCRYMSGLNTKYSNLRYGNAGPGKEGRGGDSIFIEPLGSILRSIIEFGSIDSHTNEAFPYTIDDKDLSLTENEKELFFSYVLQLCHVIKFFGNFADSHNDVKVNRSMIKSISVLDPSECEGSEGVVETDGANHYCDKCVLADSAKRYIGKRVKLFNVKLNYRETKDKYPFFARYEVLDK